VIIEARVVGQRSYVADREVPLAVGASTTLRELIGELVALELAEYTERQEQRTLLRVLTPADLATGGQSGRYGGEQRAAQPAPSIETALARAIEGFTDGLYFAFLDEQQIEDLDAPLTPTTDSRLRFVRLVALAGG
jgi:hypothetical protein